MNDINPDNVVYIGGNVKREYPVVGKKTVYINPSMNAYDHTNNEQLRQLID